MTWGLWKNVNYLFKLLQSHGGQLYKFIFKSIKVVDV